MSHCISFSEVTQPCMKSSLLFEEIFCHLQRLHYSKIRLIRLRRLAIVSVLEPGEDSFAHNICLFGHNSQHALKIFGY